MSLMKKYFWKGKENYNMFEIIKNYYDKGIYSNQDVKTFVKSGHITEIQYKEIVGKLV